MATFAERWVSLTASQFERTWPVLYQMLKFIEEHEIYKDKTKTSDHKTHENFQSYFEAKVRQQFAVWSDMEVAYHFAVDHCPELLAKAFSEAKAYILQKNGGDRKSELYYNTDFGDPLPERGTAASYLTARLARDRPDILDQLKAGAYKSVRAAAIAAGIVQPTTPLQYVQTGWRKAAIEDKKKIVVWIQDQLQNDPELLGNIG
jgi:hypothetical protein